MSSVPETRFVRAGEVDIAYQTFGSGAHRLVWVPGWISHVEAMWDLPEFARFLEGLGRFSRVAVFDKRGTGMSDRINEVATLEERMDDIRAAWTRPGSSARCCSGGPTPARCSHCSPGPIRTASKGSSSGNRRSS